MTHMGTEPLPHLARFNDQRDLSEGQHEVLPRPNAESTESDYGHPFGWWGYHWTPPEPRSLPWLVTHDLLDRTTAAFLSLAIEARVSVVVVSEPHEAGKTTLLTA